MYPFNVFSSRTYNSKGSQSSSHYNDIYSMAADIVFSEVLCFIRNNFDKLTASEIKPVLCSFYG